MKNKKIIFIALDCSVLKAKSIIKSIPKIKLKKYEIGIKAGYQILYSDKGRNFIKSLKGYKKFIDLKLNDVPNTVKNGILSLRDLKADYITIHASAGSDAIKLAKKYSGKTKLLAVSVLTSMNKKNLSEIGHTKKLDKLVIHLSKLAKKAGAYAMICSPHESKKIKKLSKLPSITPGIRLPGDQSGDQKRIATPRFAFDNGAIGIVMGRSLIKGNIKNNFKRLFQHLDS